MAASRTSGSKLQRSSPVRASKPRMAPFTDDELLNLLENEDTATTSRTMVGGETSWVSCVPSAGTSERSRTSTFTCPLCAKTGTRFAVPRIHRDQALVGRGEKQAVAAGGARRCGAVCPVGNALALETSGIGRLVDLRVHAPAFLAAGRIEGDHLAEGIADHQMRAGRCRQQRRRGLEIDHGFERRVGSHGTRPVLPGKFELADIVTIDLLQRRVAAAALVTTVIRPALGTGNTQVQARPRARTTGTRAYILMFSGADDRVQSDGSLAPGAATGTAIGRQAKRSVICMSGSPPTVTR